MSRYYQRDDINSEGYKDTTAYLAIKRVEGFDKTYDPHLYKYAKKKLYMLMGEFLVIPTAEEIDALFALKTERAIDKAAVKIIVNHWKDD